MIINAEKIEKTFIRVELVSAEAGQNGYENQQNAGINWNPASAFTDKDKREFFVSIFKTLCIISFFEYISTGHFKGKVLDSGLQIHIMAEENRDRFWKT